VSFVSYASLFAIQILIKESEFFVIVQQRARLRCFLLTSAAVYFVGPPMALEYQVVKN
jgi:hypothetical protein